MFYSLKNNDFIAKTIIKMVDFLLVRRLPLFFLSIRMYFYICYTVAIIPYCFLGELLLYQSQYNRDMIGFCGRRSHLIICVHIRLTLFRQKSMTIYDTLSHTHTHEHKHSNSARERKLKANFILKYFLVWQSTKH